MQETLVTWVRGQSSCGLTSGGLLQVRLRQPSYSQGSKQSPLGPSISFWRVLGFIRLLWICAHRTCLLPACPGMQLQPGQPLLFWACIVCTEGLLLCLLGCKSSALLWATGYRVGRARHCGGSYLVKQVPGCGAGNEGGVWALTASRKHWVNQCVVQVLRLTPCSS